MSWFKRVKEGILTKTQDKKSTPDGLWYKCKECKTPTSTKEFEQNLWVCPHCDNHARIGSKEYFELLFDEGKFTELNPNLFSGDPLTFEDTKPYPVRLELSKKKSGLNDAVRTGIGKINGIKVSMAVMDFDFIEKGVENGAPKYMEWYSAFGLLVTLIWLYIEILSLLAKLSSRK